VQANRCEADGRLGAEGTDRDGAGVAPRPSSGSMSGLGCSPKSPGTSPRSAHSETLSQQWVVSGCASRISGVRYLARIDAYLTETARARTRHFAALHPAEQQLRGRSSQGHGFANSGLGMKGGTVLAEGRTRFTAEVFMVEEPGRVRPLWQVGPTPRTQCDV
jgi:hypothetical protein